MSLVFLDHVWHEFLAHPEMGDNVDLEDGLCPLIRSVKNRVWSANASVVDEDGRVAPR